MSAMMKQRDNSGKTKIFGKLIKLAMPAFVPVMLLLGSCNNGAPKTPDVSNVKIDLQTERFDKDLYALDTNNIGGGLAKLKVKYPDFLNYFLDTLMAYEIHGNYTDTVAGIREGLRQFLVYKDFKDLEDTINVHFPNTNTNDEKLVTGFKMMKHYFPDYRIPRVFYLNLGLSKWRSFPLDSNTLCIALDMFLGDNFAPYKAIGLEQYMLSHSRGNYIPVAAFSAIYKGFHPFKPDEKTLLDLMVQRGKEQYFLHKILPGTPDSVLFGFTQKQLEWCGDNEALIYNFFIHQNLLFSKEAHSVMPYVTDGPFARGLEPVTDVVKITPGNIGSWIGYRIVSSYMSQHPDVTLSLLVNQDSDPAKLLDEAKYKPK
jgi:hypothetical protein